MGAEPDMIDAGPCAGLRLFTTEREASLKLMQSLKPKLQEKATLCHSVLPADLPEGRWTAHDERHLGGARHDNRIVPYGECNDDLFASNVLADKLLRLEGCPASDFNADQKANLVQIFTAFNEYYPEPVLRHRIETFQEHLDQTYFAWIGSHEEDSVYYFRIHSPVAFMEFDFHSGGKLIRGHCTCATDSKIA